MMEIIPHPEVAVLLESKKIFQNENLIVIDKPTGVLSVPSRMGAKDPRRCIGIELEKELKQKVFPVHRLDFEVSGVLIFALRPESHSVLSRCFEAKKIKKSYELLSAEYPPSSFQLEKKSLPLILKSQLVRGKKRSFEAAHGKEAITHIVHFQSFQKEGETYHYFQVNPETGRPHQIRYELKKLGFPILGDSLYGSTKKLQKDEIALRAYQVEFLETSDLKKLQVPQKIQADFKYHPDIF